MSVRLYTNNASDTLNGAITNSATTITLNDASEFPVPGAGEIAYATIDDNTNVEIITYTGVSTNDLTGVTRGVDGTSGTAFADATAVEVRATASSFEDVLQADETPELQGPLDCSNSGVYIGFGGSSTSTAYNISHSANVPRLVGAANYYWGFSGTTKLYCQAGTTFNKIEFANDSTRFRIWTNNSERLSLNDSGLQLGAANARVTTILDEDTMSSDSATALATQQSIKAYVDDVGGTTKGFRADSTNAQSITASTYTKMQLDTEVFDTEGDYDPTTNYRHTPSLAGKWLYISTVSINTLVSGKYLIAAIRKNGSTVQENIDFVTGGGNWTQAITVVEMNGSSDYVELFIYQNDTVTRTTQTSGAVNNLIGIYLGA